MNIILLAGYIFLALLLLIGVIIFSKKIIAKKLLLKSLGLKLLLIKVPQKVKKEEKEALNEINLFSQLISILAGLKSPFAFEVAVPSIGEEIYFYLAVSRKSIEFVSRQIQGLWPDAQVEETDDYTIFTSGGAASAAYLKQKNSQILPIRTYLDAQLDTFLPILSNFSKLLAVGEGLCFQIIAKPAPISIKKNTLNSIKQIKRGRSLEEALRGRPPLADLLISKKEEKKEAPTIDEEAVKMLENRLTKPLFSVNVRILASANTPFRTDELLDNLAGSFSEFANPKGNEFKVVKPKNPRELIFQSIFREFNNNQIMTLGADELSSLFHFPITGTEIPKIKWLKTRSAPPPVTLPKEGTVIGESVFRGESKPVKITEDDRRRHVYLIGQTGTGKSTLLVNMAVADIENNKGMAVLDPHGDLIDSILELIPQNRLEDVILFDPGDILRPIGLNMLEYDISRPEEKTFIVNEMMGIFDKLFDLKATGGPMFEQYARNALLLLMDDPSEFATLMEVPRIFSDAEFRQRKLSRATNPIVVDFWEKEAVKAGGEASLANITPYITSKFNNFTANDYIRPIIGQPKSAFNFRKIMDEGKILLVNLSKGRIGDINAGLLGMVIVGKLLMAALSRVDVPQEKRRDFYLYIDEFQNFTTDSIATILSEARKYRLDLVIAHQFIAQLIEKIRDAVFGNVGTIIAFRVGTEDAEFLAKQFEPVFNQTDLINLDNFNAYLKILISGQTSKPFNIRTLPVKTGDRALHEKIKEMSRLTYGKDRQEVETEILKRLRG
jgi:energy-coupling factor transporter ATP-binding protein EcfA2